MAYRISMQLDYARVLSPGPSVCLFCTGVGGKVQIDKKGRPSTYCSSCKTRVFLVTVRAAATYAALRDLVASGAVDVSATVDRNEAMISGGMPFDAA